MGKSRGYLLAGVGMAVILAVAQGAAAQTVTTTIAGHPQPLGIESAPTLRWTVAGNTSAQRRFRVVVAVTADAAARGDGPGVVWDSGASKGATTSIRYSGPALRSRQRYYWAAHIELAKGQRVVSAPDWFETGILDPAQWEGSWIGGPDRIARKLSNDEGSVDDLCCVSADTRLVDPASPGSTHLTLASTLGVASGLRLTIDGEPVVVGRVLGAAATSTTAEAAAVGDAFVKVESTSGFEVGGELRLAGKAYAITSVGSPAGTGAIVAATAAGSDTVAVSIARTAGYSGEQAGPAGLPDLRPGQILDIDGERRTIVSVQRTGGFGGGGGGGGGGARNAVTLDRPLTSAHAVGALVRTTGTGLGISRPLQAAVAAGAPVSSPGLGLELTAPIRAAHPAGAVVKGPLSKDVCRPGRGLGQASTQGLCQEVRPAPMLRKTFVVAPVDQHGAVRSARLYISGLGWVSPEINGKPLMTGLGPSFSDYASTVFYRTLDVTPALVQAQGAPSRNVVSAVLGSGQFDNDTDGGNWRWVSAEWRASPRLKADLYITYADGVEQVVRSDASWKVNADGPFRYDGFYHGETYDARREIAGWDLPQFDDSAWAPARLVMPPAGRLTADLAPPTELIAKWPAGERRTPSPGRLIYDTGAQRTGWATITVRGAAPGTPIQLLYSDKTDAAGQVSVSGCCAEGQIQTDIYVTKGSPSETYTPRLTFKGFQYIAVSGLNGAPLPAGVEVTVDEIDEVRSAMAPTSTFSSSSPLLNQIEQNVRRAVAMNYVGGVITDTPEYEKNPWTGDASLSAGFASILFDTEGQYRKSFQDMADAQTDQGEVTLLAPHAGDYGLTGYTFKGATCCGATPIWDSFWFVLPMESYRRYGDMSALEKTYPLMRKYLDSWVPRWTDKDGDAFAYTLTSGLGDWLPPTGEDGVGPTAVRIPTSTASSSTAYYAYLASLAAEAARALGRPEEAARYDQLFENIKRDYNAKWWDAERGYYREKDDTFLVQTEQILPLVFGLAPAERRAAIQAKLIEDVVKTRDGHEMVGIVGARWIFKALSDAARDHVPGADAALAAIATQTTYPSYGYWAGRGWTALGEAWEASSRTRSHHMFGAIALWMYEDLAGIESAAPGYERIAIRPLPIPGVNHVKAEYRSVRGPIRSEWTASGGAFKLDVEVPTAASATVELPVNGQVTVSTGPGAAPASRNGGGRYEVGPGHYTFTVR